MIFNNLKNNFNNIQTLKIEKYMNNLKILITKLSTNSRLSLEKSANTCISQQNYEIEVEHFLLELLLQHDKNDLQILAE